MFCSSKLKIKNGFQHLIIVCKKPKREKTEVSEIIFKFETEIQAQQEIPKKHLPFAKKSETNSQNYFSINILNLTVLCLA